MRTTIVTYNAQNRHHCPDCDRESVARLSAELSDPHFGRRNNQQFKIPKDQKFNVDGQETDAFGLKKGMKVSATKIVEVPVVT